ncbi:MAG: fibronectin type III domain-containing protein, partial [Cyclobacteriaceae bacterium]|nr:fibronectin type III domain-containing protein [Cyclobacteriaceae bacterium]
MTLSSGLAIRQLPVLLLFAWMLAAPIDSLSQNHYYHNFNISGSIYICPDGTTQYVYSGPSESLTWNISGGTIVGTNTGSAITVTWSSSSGTLSAAGIEEVCWIDPEYSPPVLFCDYNHYTSSAFSVYGTAASVPVALSALNVTTTSFTARWNAVASATSYQLDVSTVSNFATYVSGYSNLIVSGTTQGVTGLTAGGTYYYRVQGYNCNGISAESGVIQVRIIPEAPVMNPATNATYKSFSMSWNAVFGATGYRLDISTNSNFLYDLNLYNDLPVSGTQFEVFNLVPGTTYYFRVQAVNPGGASGESNAESISTIPPPPLGGPEICVGSTYSYYPSFTSPCTQGCTSTVTHEFIVTGGSVVEQGPEFVFITWTSPSGNLTISSSDRVCYPDVLDQYGNVVCQTTVYPQSIDVAQHVVSLHASGPTSVCEGEHVVLNANSGSGLTYQWMKNGSPITGSASTFTVGQTNLATESGNYHVIVTKYGCSLPTVSIDVEIKANPPQPTISAKPLEIIPGATLLTVANPSSTVQWKRDNTLIGGATQFFYVATGSGNYSALTWGSNGCSSASVDVGVTGNPNNFSVSNSITVPGITTEAQLYDLIHNASKFLQTVGYSDEAGRPSQTVATGSSPITAASITRKDMISFEEYDELGRTAKKYLPFMSQQANGFLQANPLGAQTAFYQPGADLVMDDEKPYALTEFENSPLSRPKIQGAVGAEWQPDVAPRTMNYGTNTDSGADAIQLYSVSGSLPISASTYPAGVLGVAKVTNEQNVESQSVTTRDGLNIVTRTKVGSEWAETYYVYDALEQLRFVLPPELMKLLRQGSNFSPTQQQVDAWAYQSVYDNDGREVETKGPGTGWVYTIYDSRDRVVLTQDARQRLVNDWSYTKYDVLNRPVISGLYHSPTSVTRSAMQAQVDALSGNTGYQNILTQAGIVTGTEDNVFPDGNDEPLVISYYDDYSTCAPCGDTNLQFVQESWSDSLDLSSAKNQVLGFKIASSVRLLNTATWLKTVSYYNRNGEVIQVIGANHLGGRDRVSTLMDFTGKTIEERHTATGYNSGGINTIRKRFTYDHAGRLEKTLHKINSQPEVIISKLEYNEIGQVIRKRLHSEDDGATFLQNIDFRYNIRGWMTHMNNLPVDDSNDYFGMELAYNGAVPSGGGNPTRKDGMITAVNWKEDLSEKRRLYNFTYDSFGQLNAGAYKAGIRTANNPPAYDWSKQPDFYNESGITHDFNGNIKTLNRNSGIYSGSGYTATAIDQLTYDYSAYGGNQLGKVTEGLATANKDKGFKDGSNTGDDYGYDVNGALLYDRNKAIDSIKYYFNDRVKRVRLGNGYYLKYTYDAAGLKLKEEYYKVKSPADSLAGTKDYVGGIELLNGQVLQVGFDEGRITAPSVVNFMDNKEAGSPSGYTPQNASVTAAYITGQTYVSAFCTALTSTGVYPIATTKGNSFPVKKGETYTFRVLGFQSAGTTAKLYVKTNRGDLVWQGALPYGASNQDWVSATFTIPDSATWIQVGVRWSAPAINHRFYINRVALYKTDFEYNYFLTDQVGSPRAVLQTTPATLVFMATMETKNHVVETENWSNLDPSYMIVIPSANSTPGGSQAFRLNSNKRIGPARTFKVFPGDAISGEVTAYFTSTSGFTAATAGVMAAAVSGALAGGAPAIDAAISTAYSTTDNPLIALSGFGGSTFPSGYLNYILFDEHYKPIRAKSFPVQNLPGTKHTVQFDAPLEIKELGYLFVYLSYDNNNTNLHLYFDDFKITHQESPVIQVNNYYPFGMVSNTWLREGEINNANLFQGKELIAQTGWHDFGSRMYWADLGRWFSNDPQARKMPYISNYASMMNNPVTFTDPDGECPICIVALIGGVINVATHWDKISTSANPWLDGFVAFGIGAGAGALGAVTGGAAFAAAGGGTTLATLGAGGFMAGLAGGAVGSAFAMPIQSLGNSLYFGVPMMPAAEYGIGILTGGVIGGGIN